MYICYRYLVIFFYKDKRILYLTYATEYVMIMVPVVSDIHYEL